jgi:hypothetical protein
MPSVKFDFIPAVLKNPSGWKKEGPRRDKDAIKDLLNNPMKYPLSVNGQTTPVPRAVKVGRG